MNVRQPSPEPELEPCPLCGGRLGGRKGCQAAFDELSASSWTSPARGAVHNMVVDVYAMQHPEEYGASAKSYIRHLSALACLIEHPGDQELYWARPARWRPIPVPTKPDLIAVRGDMTVADVRAARDDAEYQALVRRWAAVVWAAYESQHRVAREYLSAVSAALGRTGQP